MAAYTLERTVLCDILSHGLLLSPISKYKKVRQNKIRDTVNFPATLSVVKHSKRYFCSLCGTVQATLL